MKKSVLSILFAVCMALSLSVFASAADLPLVYDEADLLTDTEEANLLSRLEAVSVTAQMDVVVAAVNSTGELSPMEYADDFFDYNGYGQGSTRDGLVLLISMEERDWWISTCGYAITAFTDAGIDYIGEQITPYLSDGDYATAFEEFAEQCDAFVKQARTGDPFDTHNLPKEPFNKGIALVIALAAGLILAFIYTGKLKGQLNTVRRQTAASSYVKDGGVNITTSRDFFLYRSVQKTAKETSDSSGGSSTHTSSSGSSHGGGGGKF